MANCVAAHLIKPVREGANLHNAIYSFVAGLAHRLDKPILKLAQGDALKEVSNRSANRTAPKQTLKNSAGFGPMRHYRRA